MLTKDEEGRLAAFLGVLRYNIEHGILVDPAINMESFLWLAEKLKEATDILKAIDSKSHNFETIEDRVIFSKAKQWLMEKYELTEKQAYSFMQVTAMETRVSKVDIAKRILEESLSP